MASDNVEKLRERIEPIEERLRAMETNWKITLAVGAILGLSGAYFGTWLSDTRSNLQKVEDRTKTLESRTASIDKATAEAERQIAATVAKAETRLRNYATTAVNEEAKSKVASLQRDVATLTSSVTRITDRQKVAGVTERRKTITVGNGADGDVAAPCEQGEILTGGGYAIDNNSTFHLLVRRSFPDGNTWRVHLRNTDNNPFQVTVFALCARL